MNKENVITLDNPVKRGEQVIEQVTLMKPNAGTLRGVSLAAVANSEVDALIKVLPRMTAPMLTEQEVAALELPDLVALVGKVVGFCRRTRCSDVSKNLSVDDLMADVAVIFHLPPSELYPMSLTELITWREKALRRSGNTNE